MLALPGNIGRDTEGVNRDDSVSHWWKNVSSTNKSKHCATETECMQDQGVSLYGMQRMRVGQDSGWEAGRKGRTMKEWKKVQQKKDNKLSAVEEYETTALTVGLCVFSVCQTLL